ncbi:MAG: hypothetical protein M1330_03280 [Armatimonadetes bacterium]|nr:hypothetical protein [Armatimonadota bacterium]
MKTGWLFIALGALLASSAPSQGLQIASGTIRIVAVKQADRWIGFDLYNRNHLVAPVRLSSNGIITADVCRAETNYPRLVFTALVPLRGCGLQLGESDYIEVALLPKNRYPHVVFHLTIQAFDSSKWLTTVGKSPFHFLSLYMPDAMAWHIQGWLNATPYADPFPLLLDRHAGTPEISAYHYNRNWSYTPPLGAQALPVIGLWAPQRSLYAGFEFQSTRLLTNTEKYVATGYCWREATPSHPNNTDDQFVSLVYPYGGLDYQKLEFPKPGDVIASDGYLIWSQDLPATRDPNELLWSFIWKNYRNDLPRVPRRVDLSWLPGGDRMQDFDGPFKGNLIAQEGAPFQVPGSVDIEGWRSNNESMVDVPVRDQDTSRIAQLEEQAAYLVKNARWFDINQAGASPKRFLPGPPALTEGKPIPAEIGCYWDKPIKGRWTDEWGGAPVTSLHNSNGWAAGRLLLDLYRDRGETQYLPYVDGVFNWTRSIAWTRNEFPDVPSSPFAIGGTLSAAFCLDYYFTFKDDPVRATRAKEALHLARAFVYRYMTMWPSDNNRDDNLDSAFLWEPNSGRDWTGTACANEVFWDLDTLGQVAVETGDPILMYALQGSLDRWYQLYKDEYHSSIADYPGDALGEEYGLFPGRSWWPGKHADYGTGSTLPMEYPVGDTRVRVLAGEKAAMAFDRDGAETRVSDYRYQPTGNLSFRVDSKIGHPFDLSLTCPYVDLSKKQVSILRGTSQISLAPGTDFIRPPQALWSLIINNVQNDDTIVVGHPAASLPVLPSEPPLTDSVSNPAAPPGFQYGDLICNIRPDTSWHDLSSWSGLWRGSRWVLGVPFTLAPAGAKSAVKGQADLIHPLVADEVCVLYSDGSGALPSLILQNGRRLSVTDERSGLAWKAWPPIFTARLLMGWVKTDGQPVTRVDAGSRLVFAVTGAARQAFNPAPLQFGIETLRQLQTADRFAAGLRDAAAAIPNNSFAILPPQGGASPVSAIFGMSGLNDKALILTPQQLVNASVFNSQKIKAAFDLDGEQYIQTVNAPGDAADALVQYLHNGGTLILMAGGPWPLFYPVGPGGQMAAAPLTGRLGLPLVNTIETLPSESLQIEEVPGQTVFTGLPKTITYPNDNPRLRAITTSTFPAGVQYQPIYRVVGASGKDYGVAAALLTFPGGGRILYISDVLTTNAEYSQPLVEDVIGFLRKITTGDAR